MALTLGKKVTFIEFASRALAAYPEKYVNNLVEKMRAQGAEFYFGEAVCSRFKKIKYSMKRLEIIAEI